MLVTIVAIGRLKAGPERVLLRRYLDQAGQAGRAGPDAFRRMNFESRAGSAAPKARKLRFSPPCPPRRARGTR
jgi:23S rRNA (pseudouridine1915-N3)-methyltransferase